MELISPATHKETDLPEQIRQQDFVMKDNKLYESFPCSIYVTGFGSGIDEEELKNYFSTFGVVTSVCLVKSRNYFAFVEFDSPDPVKTVTNNDIRHKLGERKLYVRKKKDRTFAKKENSEKSCEIQKELVASLKMCNTVQDQVEMMYNALKLSEEEIENRYNICSHLESLLRPYYPQCTLTVFGSTANDFGFKGCDVDVLFQRNNIPEPVADRDIEEVMVPTVRDVKNGKFPLTSLNKLHKFKELRFIKKVLHQKSAKFQEVTLIPASICPLLKITSKTQLRCDLSNGPRFPLHNTSLFKFIGKCDRRVLLIMSVIRYWVKYVCKIARLSSYAISLVVIFFLQTREPPVIPTIKHIQSKADVQIFEGGYNCTVPALSEAEKFEPSSNTQTAGDLIAEFFAYFEEFDFANFVLCTLTGSRTTKKIFESEHKDFKISALCIQDPFETDRNVTGNVTLSVILRLIDCFHEASDIVKGGSDKWDLSQLFENCQGNTDEVERKYAILHSTNMLPILREKFSHNSYSDTVLNHIWLIKSTEILLDMLSHGLFFEYEIIDLAEDKHGMWRKTLLPEKDDDKSRSNMHPSTCEQDVTGDTGNKLQQPTPQIPCDAGKLSKSLECSDIEPFLTAQFTVSNRTWVGRRVFKSKYQSLKSSLDVERKISLEIMQEWSQQLEEQLMFDIEFFECLRGGYVTLFARLKSFEFKPELLELGRFLESHVAKTVESVFYSKVCENEL